MSMADLSTRRACVSCERRHWTTLPRGVPGTALSEHTCALVSPEVGALTYGLSYNSYLDQFIAIGVGRAGFYYSLSPDLISWSPRAFLMEAAQTFNPAARPPFLPYPTLIDHNSPSSSFDVTGQTPYLYFSRFNGSGSALDTDLMRIAVRIDK